MYIFLTWEPNRTRLTFIDLRLLKVDGFFFPVYSVNVN